MTTQKIKQSINRLEKATALPIPLVTAGNPYVLRPCNTGPHGLVQVSAAEYRPDFKTELERINAALKGARA